MGGQQSALYSPGFINASSADIIRYGGDTKITVDPQYYASNLKSNAGAVWTTFVVVSTIVLMVRYQQDSNLRVRGIMPAILFTVSGVLLNILSIIRTFSTSIMCESTVLIAVVCGQLYVPSSATASSFSC